jgi:hypothetical protein
MSAWTYLKAGFWQHVSLPLLGRVPLNAAALAGFGIAGFDHPAFWAAGAAWQAVWLTATTGRVGYRRAVDRAARRVAWRRVEERRLQLYNQLPEADRLRHHTLRGACQKLIAPRPDGEPDPAAELFTWLHLKLLLARWQATAGQRPGADPDVPRLHAGAAVEITDPSRSRLAEEAVAILDPRQGLHPDATLPLLPRIDAALRRIESELAAAATGTNFSKIVSETQPEPILTNPTSGPAQEVDQLLQGLQEQANASENG